MLVLIDAFTTSLVFRQRSLFHLPAHTLHSHSRRWLTALRSTRAQHPVAGPASVIAHKANNGHLVGAPAACHYSGAMTPPLQVKWADPLIHSSSSFLQLSITCTYAGYGMLLTFVLCFALTAAPGASLAMLSPDF